MLGSSFGVGPSFLCSDQGVGPSSLPLKSGTGLDVGHAHWRDHGTSRHPTTRDK